MTVIDQLKQMYPSIITRKPEDHKIFSDYVWFETNEMETIGIRHEELDAHSTELLSVFLTPVSLDQPAMTIREKNWSSLLQEGQWNGEIESPDSYRFVLFSIEDSSTDKEIVQEAFQSLFPQEMPILWKTDRDGFIIEEVFSEQQETLSFEGIPDVLMSDFYTKIQFFISEFSSDVKYAPFILEWSEDGARLAKERRLDSVVTYIDIMPYIYLDSLSVDKWQHIKRSVFQGIEQETDLLQTIRVFLESGSNTTLAAKKLYMHRNSLQYRVDKFIEKTGLDVKQFEGAVITYLALLNMDH
ncbi:PucR family transcriptional regulator [Halobacillus sp. H74]|uniref:PucR family transcriptional regulator n=1 Tax=Halobacillus sp. H74 TaxID=3457436 RepID=UPI003FCEA499